MRICLLSRFFDLRNAGLGRYSVELRGLRGQGLEVRTASQRRDTVWGGKYEVSLHSLRNEEKPLQLCITVEQ